MWIRTYICESRDIYLCHLYHFETLYKISILPLGRTFDGLRYLLCGQNDKKCILSTKWKVHSAFRKRNEKHNMNHQFISCAQMFLWTKSITLLHGFVINKRLSLQGQVCVWRSVTLRARSLPSGHLDRNQPVVEGTLDSASWMQQRGE